VCTCTIFIVSTVGYNQNKIYIKSELVKYRSDVIYGRLLRRLYADGMSACFNSVYLHIGRDIYWRWYKHVHISKLAWLGLVTISEREVRLQYYRFALSVYGFAVFNFPQSSDLLVSFFQTSIVCNGLTCVCRMYVGETQFLWHFPLH
jgi:hypothetical protein